MRIIRVYNMHIIVVLFYSIVFFSIHSVEGSGRIVGGSETTIENYPFAALILVTDDQVVFRQQCGGSILNNRSILTAAHCINPNMLQRFRVRLGSSYASRGGLIYHIASATIHPDYNTNLVFDSDIAILRMDRPIMSVPNAVAQGAIAGPNYIVPDDTVLVAIGWGITSSYGGPPSEQLRHVEVLKVNQDICRRRWFGMITDNMMCAGWLDIGGRGQCGRDSGGPLLHNNVIVGVNSFADGTNCVSPIRPNVNVRVSRFTAWILANA